ncbi:hypothetical protein ACFE04_023770 [Oxalis oulophora]
MSSLLDTVYQQLMVPLRTQYLQGDANGWVIGFEFAARMVVYFTLLGMIVVFLLWILKYLGNFNYNSDEDEIRATERIPIWPRNLRNKVASLYSYGTYEKDLESGNCSSSSSNDNNCVPEELYDGKVCVICYDEERNSFFVPCGHCATCYDCAKSSAVQQVDKGGLGQGVH